MGRPESNTVKYFIHDTDTLNRKTIYTLKRKYKNDGYAFWFQLLEMLGSTENHYIDCRDSDTWEFFVAKMGVDEDICVEILDTLVKLKAIDKELWTKFKVIWSQGFVDRLKVVYEKRKGEIPVKPDFRTGNSPDAKVSASETKVSPPETHNQPTNHSNHTNHNSFVKGKTPFTEESFEYKIALRIKENVEALKNIKLISETSLQSWANAIRLMQTRDGLTQEEIIRYLDWAFADDFWRTVIQSGQAFRRAIQKGTLQGAMERAKKKSKIGASKASDQKSDLDKVLGGSGE